MKCDRLDPMPSDLFPPAVRRLEYTSDVDALKDWALVWPPESCTTWVVCIHGHGADGAQLYTRPDVKTLWLPEFRGAGLGVLTPNLRGNAWMAPPAAADLHALLQVVRSEFDAESFVLASGSMGGTSNVIYAALHPEDVAGVVARGTATDLASYHQWCRAHEQNGTIRGIANAIEASYGGTPEDNPDVYAEHSAVARADRLTMPTFVVHGSRDAIIPVSQTRRLAAAMGDSDHFVYSEIPDGGHDSPLRHTESFDWVMDHLPAPQ